MNILLQSNDYGHRKYCGQKKKKNRKKCQAVMAYNTANLLPIPFIVTVVVVVVCGNWHFSDVKPHWFPFSWLTLTRNGGAEPWGGRFGNKSICLGATCLTYLWHISCHRITYIIYATTSVHRCANCCLCVCVSVCVHNIWQGLKCDTAETLDEYENDCYERFM